MLRNYRFEAQHPDGTTLTHGVAVVSPDTQLAAREGLVEKVKEAAAALGIQEHSEQIRRSVAACTAIDGKPLVIPLTDGKSVLITAQQMPGCADPVGFDTAAKDHGTHARGASFQ